VYKTGDVRNDEVSSVKRDRCVYSHPLTILPLMQSQDVVRWRCGDELRATLGYSLASAKSPPHAPVTILYLLLFLLDPAVRLLRELKLEKTGPSKRSKSHFKK